MGYACDCAAAFHENHISPSPIHSAKFFARADDSESCAFVQLDAGHIFGENSRLQSPNAFLFGGRHQRVEQTRSNFSAARFFCNINAHFGDASVHAPARNWAQRCPAQNFRTEARHESAGFQMPCIPFFPFGSRFFECGVARAIPSR